MKQTAVEWLIETFNITNVDLSHHKLIIEQAKEMEKEQIKDSFVECWKSNVPDGIECKLDAEQYYNETFKSE
jgi:uncharacterized protein YbaA (DUF1428 family)